MSKPYLSKLRAILSTCALLGSTAVSAASVPVYRLNAPHEHFWTRSPTGEGASKIGYSWEGMVFFILSSPRTAQDFPIYRLAWTAGHTFTASATERAQLLQAGYIDEGILGYASSNAEPGFRPLHVWRRMAGSQPIYFYSAYYEIENAAIVSAGYTYQGQVGFVPTSGTRPPVPYQVGAYYFGMFSPLAVDSRSSVFPSRNFYLRSASQPPEATDWWAGVRDLRQGTPFNTLSSTYTSLSTETRSLYESWRSGMA